MKKSKRIILLILLVFLLTLSGCDAIFNFDNGDTIKNEENEGPIINTQYGLVVNDVSAYNSISETIAATTVANIVMPATVEISCTVNFEYSYLYGGFFGGYTQRTVSDSESCVATAFFINEDGYLLTNAHVVTVENESSYRDLVYTSWDIQINYAESTTKFPVKIVAYDVDLDLAILKCDEKIDNLQYVTFFNITSRSSEKYNTDDAVKLYYGEYVVAIGNARGYGISVTTGVVSAPYRLFTENNVITEAIQTDAAINSGNSGGPLANMYGAVIGINSFKISSSSTDNLGFAIPSNVVLEYIEKVKTSKSIDIKYYTTNERAYSK